MAPLSRPARFLFLAFLLFVGSAAGQETATATTTATSPAFNGTIGWKTSCASKYEGCTRCSTKTCTKCRPNSTFDAGAGKCACNAGYGTFAPKYWDAYVEGSLCKDKGRNCRRPKYSSIAGKCLRCADYGDAIAQDGACVILKVSGVLNTMLTIKNDMEANNTGGIIWIGVQIAVCDGMLCSDSNPEFRVLHQLRPGESVTKEGWTTQTADVTARIVYAQNCTPIEGWPGLCGKNSYYFFPPNTIVRAGNPMVGSPWVEINGEEFTMEQMWNARRSTFVLHRGYDDYTAKDWTLNVRGRIP